MSVPNNIPMAMYTNSVHKMMVWTRSKMVDSKGLAKACAMMIALVMSSAKGACQKESKRNTATQEEGRVMALQ